MKKSLLLILLILFTFNLRAQNLITENCSNLITGNIGTDIAGTNAGQGGWYTRTLAPSNGNNNFQIVDVSGVNGNSIKITGFEGAAVTGATAATTNSRFLYKSIATAWTNRDFGAEIAEVEYDFYTGAANTSGNVMRVALYDGLPFVTTTKVIAGLLITMNPFTIRGLAWYDPVANGSTGAVSSYSFGMASDGATPPVFSEITLTANTWYRVGFSFNKTTGEIKFKGAGITRNSIQGASIGTEVANITLLASTGGTTALPNLSSATGTFDNLVVRASIDDTLLAIESIDVINNSFLISPNPANNFVKISNTDNTIINEITVTDLNGRIVKTTNFKNVSNIEVNVADLTSGVYFMNINSDKGIVTKKIMKN